MTKQDCFPLAFGIAEACAAAGVQRTSLYKAIRSGQLRATKCGGRTVILSDDLRRWLEGLPVIVPQERSGMSGIVRGEIGPLPHPPTNRKLTSSNRRGDTGHFAAWCP
jgi:excisionase family DNA binding protein